MDDDIDPKIEAKLVAQEHRVTHVLYNFFKYLRYPKDDARRDAAWRAFIWTWLPVGPSSAAFGIAGLVSLTVLIWQGCSMQKANTISQENLRVANENQRMLVEQVRPKFQGSVYLKSLNIDKTGRCSFVIVVSNSGNLPMLLANAALVTDLRPQYENPTEGVIELQIKKEKAAIVFVNDDWQGRKAVDIEISSPTIFASNSISEIEFSSIGEVLVHKNLHLPVKYHSMDVRSSDLELENEACWVKVEIFLKFESVDNQSAYTVVKCDFFEVGNAIEKDSKIPTVLLDAYVTPAEPISLTDAEKPASWPETPSGETIGIP